MCARSALQCHADLLLASLGGIPVDRARGFAAAVLDVAVNKLLLETPHLSV